MSKTTDANETEKTQTKNNQAQPSIETRDPEQLDPHPIHDDIYSAEPPTDDFVRSIEENGVMEPVTINANNVIISGHRRVDAAIKTGIDKIDVTVQNLDSLDEKAAVIHYNKQRVKTFKERMREALKLEEIEKKRAKERQGARTDIGQDFAASEYGRTREKVAQETDIGSGETYRKAKKVWEKAHKKSDKLKKELDRIDAGKQSIHGAYKVLKRIEELEKLGDAVEWDTIEKADANPSIRQRRIIYDQTKLPGSKDWEQLLDSLLGEYEKKFKNPEQGDAFVFAYFLESDGEISCSDSSSAEPNSLVQRKPDKSTLEEWYWEHNRTPQMIAVQLGVHADLVDYWLFEDEIPKRKNDFGQATQEQIEKYQ
ncbi:MULTISPECIES: ParB/RepB/Spo0J family partition protein [Halorussus]|uniref:ParB/RepB/Spo0J family partition protein n=1 Tax=Halorussus TaxID=1070314 RepID=UPI00209EDE36|nr:ParB N-terminal domain-containing protein [Halorussus vallis]USZ77219.1 ParB N-terminal domain-containing protein [Halorussus vallis]